VPLLELRDVSKAFGGLQVIDHLSLHVDEGEIVSVIGPNGAGKTTVFNLITGVFPPSAGSVVFCGRPIQGRKSHEISRLGKAASHGCIRLAPRNAASLYQLIRNPYLWEKTEHRGEARR